MVWTGLFCFDVFCLLPLSVSVFVSFRSCSQIWASSSSQLAFLFLSHTCCSLAKQLMMFKDQLMLLLSGRLLSQS